ncbi:MAG: FAD-dependent oxidoreductase [Acholeplasmatales bacterium]|nr:FAD-dependent oxidoreductase [Acholeplasmatales bacterium]
MIKVDNIKVPLDYNDEIIKNLIEKKIKDKVIDFKIFKKSVDARFDVVFNMSFLVNVKNELRHKDLIYAPKNPLTVPKSTNKEVIIVGSGPAGLFSALILIEAGLKPIIVERGKDIKGREEDVANLLENKVLNPNSNFVYGLGGAGTYSDGKLTTNINSEYNSYILETFVKFGADPDILYEGLPHIGTDVLKKVVTNMANYINEHGHIYFEHELVDIIDKKIVCKNNDKLIDFNFDYLILAIGHSPKDTFKMLYEKGLFMEQKPFSMGVRIEHKQELIDKIQYKKYAGHPNLPKATYKMAVHLDSRDVYTFCMCPGGIVVPSMDSNNTIVTNGMSYKNRGLENSNAALLVNVNTTDYESNNPLAGFDFRDKYESLAYNDMYKANIARLEDFLNNRASSKIGHVKPSYPLGYTFKNLDSCLPTFVSSALKEAIPLFDKKMLGFNDPDAILTAIESRSSCPVRITRNEELVTNIDYIYAAGEGSGYAGGITTSAIDGIKIALKVINR